MALLLNGLDPLKISGNHLKAVVRLVALKKRLPRSALADKQDDYGLLFLPCPLPCQLKNTYSQKIVDQNSRVYQILFEVLKSCFIVSQKMLLGFFYSH